MFLERADPDDRAFAASSAGSVWRNFISREYHRRGAHGLFSSRDLLSFRIAARFIPRGDDC
jgi:hypothetical protein